jgi:MFS family permease
MGIGNSLFWSTSQAFTQEIVSEKEYFDANKLLSASFQIGSILGAGIGGIIVHIYDPFVALWINVGTYLISGILISLAPYKYQRKDRVSKNFFKSFFIGFTYLKKRKDIATISMTTILSDVAIWGSLSVLTITISSEIFNKGAWGYGLLDGLYGIGALLSVITVGVLSSYLNRKNILICAYIIGFISLYLSSIMPNIYIASVFFFILGININSSRIITRTIVMENVENRIMGRVQTLLGIYTRVMVVLSSLATGYLIEDFTINTAVIFACCHYFLAMLGVYFVSKVWKGSDKYLLNKDNLN